MNLSILIPTVEIRAHSFNYLVKKIEKQISNNNLDYKIEICVFKDNFQYTIGHKRNSLLNSAEGKFIVYVDDDDDIHPDYCKCISNVIDAKENIDYIGYKMSRIFNNKPQPSEYRSIQYKNCFTEIDGTSYRNVSHTNPILASIAKKFKFPDWNSGEDVEWCDQLFKSGLFKMEHYVCDDMYVQKFDRNKSLSILSKNSNDKKVFANIVAKDQFTLSEFKFVKWVYF